MQATGLKNATLAKLCGVKPPTSYNWASGKTKNIKGAPLLKASAALGVTPEWLANGKGPKFPPAQSSFEQPEEKEPLQPYEKSPVGMDQWTCEAVEIMSKLNENDRRAVVANMKTYIQNLNPPPDSQDISQNLRSSAGGKSNSTPCQKAA